MVTLPSSLKWKNPPILPGLRSRASCGFRRPRQSWRAVRHSDQEPKRHKGSPTLAPHRRKYHVLSGTFIVGMGSTFDSKGGQTMTVGSYMVVPAKMPHFATAKGDVIIQVHGIGPFGITWVNPEDASAKKPSAR